MGHTGKLASVRWVLYHTRVTPFLQMKGVRRHILSSMMQLVFLHHTIICRLPKRVIYVTIFADMILTEVGQVQIYLSYL